MKQRSFKIYDALRYSLVNSKHVLKLLIPDAPSGEMMIRSKALGGKAADTD